MTRVDATLPHASRLSGELLEHQVQLACVLEVSAAKPGNITPVHDFADATYVDMLRSAIALGPEPVTRDGLERCACRSHRSTLAHAQDS